VIVPGDPRQRTGGYLYDARVVEGLREMGWSVTVTGLAGRFPVADESAEAAMRAALAGLPDGARVVIDGLALGGLPDVVADQSQRLDLTALVHHPLADETGLEQSLATRLLASERRALAACRRVIVTSRFTARRLRELELFRGSPRVVEPGVAPAALAASSERLLAGRAGPRSQRLLCVASLTPRKGQDLLLQALSALRGHAWHCVMVGSAGRDPDFAARLGAMARELGIAERVEWAGECDEAELDHHYHRADLCLLPSHYEGYGMVVSESLARGLPLVASTGGALADTVPGDSALTFPPGDVEALAAALSRWFDEPALRLRLIEAAAARRRTLPDWSVTVRSLASALDSR
jgi:glycosyltransferase involved in cell wall biosynthesis